MGAVPKRLWGGKRGSIMSSKPEGDGARACWFVETGPAQRDDEDTLTQAIVTLAAQYGRYGYRRITALLRCEG